MDINHHRTKLLEISSVMVANEPGGPAYERTTITLTDSDGQESKITVYSDGGPLAFKYNSPRPLSKEDAGLDDDGPKHPY